jgi:hypothetical protein
MADDGGLIILEVRTRAVGGGDVITRAVVFAADDKKLAVVYADIIAAQDVGGFVDAFGNAGDEIVFFVELAGVHLDKVGGYGYHWGDPFLCGLGWCWPLPVLVALARVFFDLRPMQAGGFVRW